MLLNARKVFYEAGTHTTTLLAFEDITDRRATEERVQELLREKDMLLQEMQHRVANSLQIIASILLMKARGHACRAAPILYFGFKLRGLSARRTSSSGSSLPLGLVATWMVDGAKRS